MQLRSLCLSLFSIVGLSACEEPDAFDVADRSGKNGGGSSNSGWGCRTCGFANSPMIGQYAIDELELSYQPLQNQYGFSGLRDPSDKLYPVGLDPVGFFADVDGTPVRGVDLVGWTLMLNHGLEELEADIVGFDAYPDWADGHAIETYAIAYWDTTFGEPILTNVCSGLDLDTTSVVVIANETYDKVSGKVNPGQTGWVTLACRGHALAKMKFLGYDPGDLYKSTPDERQATLRMLRADYCGKGVAFTHVGQPLDWIDQLGHFTLAEPSPYKASDVEARWTASGAQCLNDPRKSKRADVEALCPGIPFCKTTALDPDGVTWVSINQ